ncbi:MAG: FAD binding domain-containing protein [Thermoplasmata archaeon]
MLRRLSMDAVIDFELVAPTSVEEAIATLRSGGPGEVAVLAGGTDLLLDIEHERLRPRRLLSLRRLPWKYLAWRGESLEIGSTLPLRSLEADPQLRARIPGLWEAVRAVGGVALRHRATLGGNIVRSAPISDLLPILLALDAEIDLVGPRGERTVLLDQLLGSSRAPRIEPAELVRSIRISEARPSTYLWQRVRPVNDISQVGVAVARSPARGGWQIAIGDVVPRPVRIPEAEAPLLVSTSPESIRAAAREAAVRAPFATDRRGSEEYRRQVVETLVRRAVESLVSGGLGG